MNEYTNSSCVPDNAIGKRDGFHFSDEVIIEIVHTIKDIIIELIRCNQSNKG